MKKPIKITLWTVGGIVLFVLLAIIALPLWVGPVVTTVANSIVPGYTGTDFKLESFSLNPYSGKLRVGNVTLSNPKGFDDPKAFSVKSVSVDFDTCSLLTKKIHIADISIEEPFVAYVFDGAGSNNFECIMSNAQAKIGPSAAAEEEEEENISEEEKKARARKVIIDRLAINGTAVKYRAFTLPIPIPTLTNIGKESEGATFGEVVMSVWASIQEKFIGIGGALGSAANVLGEGATNAVKGATDAVKSVGSVAETGVKAAGEGAKVAVENTTEAVKSVGNVAGAGVKAVGDGAKAAAEGAADALKKVGNLFGK